jgi:mannosidase alpha-like ER degradation enhancer 1
MSPGGKSVSEDPNPGPLKLKAVTDGFILHNMSGIRAHIVSRLDGKGYDITKRMVYFPPKGNKLT